MVDIKHRMEANCPLPSSPHPSQLVPLPQFWSLSQPEQLGSQPVPVSVATTGHPTEQ